ncbi:unnamed protein product, partial [Phaeothamnion confervicola]
NLQLDAREKRKRFAMENKFFDHKHVMAMDKKRTKDEKELAGRMRPYQRFSGSPAEHEQKIGDIAQMNYLMNRIEQLKRARSMGCRTLQEAEEYEADVRRRADEGASQQQRE